MIATVLPATDAALPCHTKPELFFETEPVAVHEAKTLCGQCPVRADCLGGALQRREPWGIWGGQMFENGRIIARKRRPGRPIIHGRHARPAPTPGGPTRVPVPVPA